MCTADGGRLATGWIQPLGGIGAGGILIGSKCVNGTRGRAHGGRVCLRLAPFWGGEAERDSPGLSSCEEEQQNLPRGARRPALGSLRGCPRPCTQASCPPLPNAASCGQRKGGRGASHLGTQLQVLCGARSLSHGPTRQPPPWEQAPGGRPCSWGRERRQLVTRPGLASADCGARLPRNTAFSAGNRGRSQRGGAGHWALCPAPSTTRKHALLSI